MEEGTEGFICINILLCRLHGGHLNWFHSTWTLVKKPSYSTGKTKNSDSAKASLVYQPGANASLFALLLQYKGNYIHVALLSNKL